MGVQRNVAHNNRRNGIFVWQNTPIRHRISDFTVYHNGGAGIEHGAYGNAYVYERLALFGNREAGIHLHAVSKEQAGGLRFRCGEIDGAGISATGALMSPSPVSGDPARFEGITIRSTLGPDFELHRARRRPRPDDRSARQAAVCRLRDDCSAPIATLSSSRRRIA